MSRLSPNTDTAGQFVPDIRIQGFSPPRGPTLPKFRAADLRSEFASRVRERLRPSTRRRLSCDSSSSPAHGGRTRCLQHWRWSWRRDCIGTVRSFVEPARPHVVGSSSLLRQHFCPSPRHPPQPSHDFHTPANAGPRREQVRHRPSPPSSRGRIRIETLALGKRLRSGLTAAPTDGPTPRPRNPCRENERSSARPTAAPRLK
jgi:hypothetical protein